MEKEIMETPQDSTESLDTSVESTGSDSTSSESESSAPSEEATSDTDSSTAVFDTKDLKDPVAIKRLKEAQALWTKTHQKRADYEKQLTVYQQKFSELQQATLAALYDPTRYNQARKELGLGEWNPQPVPPPTPVSMEKIVPNLDFSSAENFSKSLQKHMESVLAERDASRDAFWSSQLDQTIAKLDQVVNDRVSRIAEPVGQARWETAFTTAEQQYGKHFAEVKHDVINHIANGIYRGMYDGKNEQALIDKVFKAEYSDQYIAYRDTKKKAEASKRNNASSEAPSSSKSNSKKGGPKSREDYIAEINAELAAKGIT